MRHLMRQYNTVNNVRARSKESLQEAIALVVSSRFKYRARNGVSTCDLTRDKKESKDLSYRRTREREYLGDGRQCRPFKYKNRARQLSGNVLIRAFHFITNGIQDGCTGLRQSEKCETVHLFEVVRR